MRFGFSGLRRRVQSSSLELCQTFNVLRSLTAISLCLDHALAAIAVRSSQREVPFVDSSTVLSRQWQFGYGHCFEPDVR
jgi:hypothetical protein